MFLRTIAFDKYHHLGRIITYQPSPADWIEGLRRNDPATLKLLYTAHFPAVRQFVLKNNGSPDDAKDVFQEALTVLWLKAKEGLLQTNGHTNPGGYLFQVARNKWLDILRSAAHSKMHRLEVDHIPVASAAPETALEDRIQRLRAVYAKLDERCRTVLDLFYYEHKDLATIAGQIGVEEESIRTIKYRCMMKLRSFRKMIDGPDGDRAGQ